MLKNLYSGAGIIVLAALSSFSPVVMALGLGNSSVESYLNQPFRARIALITSANDDLAGISAKLASADDFELIGASLDAISVPLQFAIMSEGDEAYILVSSTQVVKDPIIRLIVEVNWANGRMLREYTLFLDPPTYTAAAPSPVIDERQQTAPALRPAATVPAQTAPAAERETPPNSKTSTAGDNSQVDGEEYGPVKSGDTLWRIASNWADGTSLDLNTVMLAIQNNNPNAFIKDNINLLKRGAILRMPNLDDVRRISPQEARNEVNQQNRALSQNKPTATAVETPLIDQSAQAKTASAPVEPDSRQDQLELVPPSDIENVDSTSGSNQALEDASASTSIETLRQELARKEEELLIEQQEKQYLADRIAELESQLESSQNGNVADDDLSQLEQQLRQDRLADGSRQSTEDTTADSQTTDAVTPPPVATSIPQVSSTDRSKKDKSFFGSLTFWIIGLMVIVAAVAGWFLSRGKSDSAESVYPDQTGGTVREIKNEAEEILKVLKEEEQPEEETVQMESVSADEEATVVTSMDSTKLSRREGSIDDAQVLDEDSVDPEVRLDLARAYMSMGDREAARVILEEVLEHGDEEQQAEANKMLKEF